MVKVKGTRYKIYSSVNGKYFKSLKLTKEDLKFFKKNKFYKSFRFVKSKVKRK